MSESLENLRLNRKEAEAVRSALKYYMSKSQHLALYEGHVRELDDLTNRISNAIIGTMIERVSK